MPGLLVIEATAPEREPFRVENNGVAGTEVVLDVTLAPTNIVKPREAGVTEKPRIGAVQSHVPTAETGKRDASDTTHPARKWTLMAGGLGVGMMATGVLFGVGARRAQALFDDAGCGNPRHDLIRDELVKCGEDNDRARRNALIANVGLIGGGLVLATSVVVFLIDPGRVERASQDRAQLRISSSSIQVVIAW
jgi:hypothetical protein